MGPKGFGLIVTLETKAWYLKLGFRRMIMRSYNIDYINHVISAPVLGFRVEDSGVPCLTQSNPEHHHRIWTAGRLFTLCLFCYRGEISGAESVYSRHILMYFSSYCDNGSLLILGGRFCSLRYIHHPALHPSQLVWNLLQVKMRLYWA